MTMQRRHFELIAQILRDEGQHQGASSPDYQGGRRQAVLDIATRFARDLSHTNPQFDRNRFLKACGVEVQS